MAVAIALDEPRRVGWIPYLWDVFWWDYVGSFRVNELIPGFRFSPPWWAFSAAVVLAAAGTLYVVRRAL